MKKNIVELIHNSPAYGFVVETGAGSTISNHLLSVPGASKTIEATFTPYSKDFVEDTLQKDLSKIRAVSKEYVENLTHIALQHKRTEFLLKKYKENFFVLASSFQIASEPTTTTHGWMAIKYSDKKSSYHFTLRPLLIDEDVLQYRKDMLHNIAEIGAAVIYRNMIESIDISNMDICQEDDDVDGRLTVIKSILSSSNDYGVVFHPKGETDRLESILRTSNELIFFKGSFNPPHKAHIEMMKQTETKLGQKGYFSISLKTFGKPDVLPEDALHRINMINRLGYSVVVNKNPLFYDFVNLFDNRLDKEARLNFVMGEDTAIRFLEVTPNYKISAIRKEGEEIFTQECLYHVYRRSGEPLVLPDKFLIYDFDISTSSTYVREHLNFDYLTDSTIEYIIKNSLYKK